MEYGKEYWFNVLTNFRKGELLISAITEQDQFIWNPVVIAPLAKDDYKRMGTFDVPQISRGEGNFWYDDGPLWDGVLVDESTRKVIFLYAFCYPKDVMGKKCPEDSQIKEDLKEKIIKRHKVEDTAPWLEDYYALTEKLLFIEALNEPKNQCLGDGWRSQAVILNFTDEDGYMAAPEQEWGDFSDKIWQELLPGDNMVFFSYFINMTFPL
ncbi:MAG: hypothetical protein RSB05_06105 [Clostridiales bacterium]